ncbi:MAG: 2-(1,2-epoxy-1,2-dihydrophenyl)acetyl-CoA isomerase [Proteobacteria bacterium]|nr:2-(1,2-epoxy-1,2-dihydrophenyl)acetyl-CoA isomerase [Pseudomonadota bacterium]
MANETVLVEKSGGITRLTLNRPDKLNALCRELGEALVAALTEADRDPTCRVVVLTGAGRGFCAGQELSGEVYAKTGPQPDLGAVLDRYNPIVEKIRSMPKPVLAAVNGVAAGAGASLALCCDIVVARRSASFLQAFAKIGLVPDCGSTWFLPRLIGDARARGHAMLAEPIKADQAEAWGMIWKAIDDDKFDAEVAALAERLSTAATHGLALQKRAFAASATNTLEAQLALEKKLQIEAASTADYREGVEAFQAKRPANFQGR